MRYNFANSLVGKTVVSLVGCHLLLACTTSHATTSSSRTSFIPFSSLKNFHRTVRGECSTGLVIKAVQTPTLESLGEDLGQSKFQNVVVVMGAGASVSAGIPDFRTPGTGLYDSLSEYNLPFPESIFDLEYYTTVNAQPFVDLSSTLWPGQDGGPHPTITHAFLKVLQDRGVLRRVYTQNIDGLEALAGVNTDKLVECHGHFRSARCTKCRTPVASIESCMETILNKQIPSCDDCGGLVKPDVVFFGEELPIRFSQVIDKDMEDCDLLIVIGTSLLVMPVAGIPQWVDRTCPRLLLNRERVGDFGHVQQASEKDGGGFFTRDIMAQGDCDDGVQKLCQLIGWKDDLDGAYSFAAKRCFRDQV